MAADPLQPKGLGEPHQVVAAYYYFSLHRRAMFVREGVILGLMSVEQMHGVSTPIVSTCNMFLKA
jgi:hypothetical protein